MKKLYTDFATLFCMNTDTVEIKFRKGPKVNKLKSLLVLFLLSLMTGGVAQAQWVPAGLTGGFIYSLTDNGGSLFAGTGSGVSLTTNNGTSWSTLNTGLTNTNIRALVVIGTNLFAGTNGGGVFHSTTNGASWISASNGLTNLTITSLAVNGTDLFAATYGGGIFISGNNGANWSPANTGLTNQAVYTFAFNGANLFAGTNNGVFLSTNNGANWTQVSNGLTNTDVRSLVFSGTNLFAGTNGGGVFLSTNNAANWTQMNSGLTNLSIYTFAVCGTNLYTGTNGGIFQSLNNGTSWVSYNSGLTNTTVTALAVSGTRLFAGTFGTGIFSASDCSVSANTGSICGMKFNDINGDGLQNGTETGLSGWTISLTYNQATGPVTTTTTTDADGKYCFNNLLAGSYTVSETQKSGWSQTFPASPGTHTVTLTSGQNLTDINFGNKADATNQGNACITWDLLSSMSVSTTSGNITGQAEVIGGGSSAPLMSVFSPYIANGQKLGVMGGWQPGSIDLQRYIEFKVSLIAGNSLNVTSVSFNYGDNPQINNFNIINSQVFYSVDGTNWTQLGATLNYLNTAMTTFTMNISGGAIVSGGQAFYLRINPYSPTGSVVTAVSFAIHNRVVICGSTSPEVITTGSICGMKFNDINGDGIQNNEESGLQGWTISLTSNGAAGSVTVTKTTGADGSYCFNDLPSGSYTVSETNQSGWSQTFPATPGNHAITLTSGQNSTGNDFGNHFCIPTITGTTPASSCGTGTVTLGATASSGTINWYDTLTGGTSLGTGTSFTTPGITTTTIYYVDATDACGTTLVRTAVTATVNALPVVSASASVAVGSTITLSPATGGTWTSSNQLIATVTNAGVVTGVSAGSATFTFTSSGTGCSATTSTVTVTAALSTPCIYLCNPDFEQFSGVTPPTGYNWIPQANISCWKTTASDGNIEIWHSGYGAVPAHSGNYFAELNATQIGTLYQDFTATAPQNVIASFWHRGRYAGVDVMNVSIVAPDGTSTLLGTYSDNNAAWNFYSTASYPITVTGTYTLKFESVSSNNGNGPLDGGNFLDDINVTCPSSICGIKYNDLNGDGQKQAIEPVLPNWEIKLTGSLSMTATTGADGSYCFNDLPSGSYTVSETNQSGWSQTFPATPGNHAINLIEGQNLPGNDFGNQQIQTPNTCDLLSATATQVTPGDCIWNLSLNQPANLTGISSIQVLALTPNQFATGTGLGTGYTSWLASGTFSTGVTYYPPTGIVPGGNLNNFLTMNLSYVTSPQNIVVNWLNDLGIKVCSDTLQLNCQTACVTLFSDTVTCVGDHYNLAYSFTNNADFGIHSIEYTVQSPGSVTITPSTVVLSTDVASTLNSGIQNILLAGALPGDQVSIITKFKSLSECCWCFDTLQVIIPSCGTVCDSLSVSAKGSPEDCCYDVSLTNSSSMEFSNIQFELLSGGIFGSMSTATSGWAFTNITPFNIINLVKLPPGTGIIGNGTFSNVLNMCIRQYSSPNQVVEVRWMKDGQVICRDTLRFECIKIPPVTDDCSQITEGSLVCLPDGTVQYNFRIQNNSNFNATGFSINPTASNVTFSQSLFANVPIMSGGQVSTMQSIILSGAGIGQGQSLCFQLTIFKVIPGQSNYYSDCCHSDTICIATPICRVPCCDKVKVEPVLDAAGKATCCAKITATCEVKAITVTVTNGTLSSVGWNCTTPVPTGYAGLATYTFAPGGCLPEMTTCVNATAPGVVITYDIIFYNGETCRKVINLDCIPPTCCDKVTIDRFTDAAGACCAKITATCEVKAIKVTVTNGTLSSANWNCGTLPTDYVGLATYTFAANGCVPVMNTCVKATKPGIVTITYDIIFSNGETCRKTVYLECIATPPTSCCEQVKVELFSTNTEGKSECCARISSTCKIKEVYVVIENGVLSSTSWTCGTLPDGYVGQSNFTFAPKGCVIDMTNCIRPIKPGLVVVYYTIYFENGEKCEKKVELDCSLASGCVTPPSGMKAWWPLDETDVSKAGSISNDLAGFNNAGTRTNGPVPVSAMVLGGLQFDGIDDYVEVPDQAELNFGKGDFSFDAWIQTTDNMWVKILIDKRNPQNGIAVNGYSIFLSDGKLCLQLADGTYTNYISPVMVADGLWHHIAITVSRANPNGILFYLDGVETQFGDPTLQPGSLDNISPLRIGRMTYQEALQFKGILDEIELFNRVITKAEIVSIFNAGSAGKCKPTGELGSICGTKFNDLNGNGRRDKEEPGISEWNIQLGGTAEMSVYTDKNGDYCFTGLKPGDYKISEELRKGWIQMLPASQGIYEVALSPGQKITGKDFGNRQRIIIKSPVDGAKILEGLRPIFEWLAPVPVPPSYKIKIVEILGNQSPDDAILMNAPWYENNEIPETSFTYPDTALKLEKNKLYACQIGSNGPNEARSDVQTFTIQGIVNPDEVSVMLQQPLPYQIIPKDLWNGTITNLGGTILKVLLTGTLEKTGTGKIIESKSVVISLNPGKTEFFNTDFNTDLVNSIFDRWGNLIDGYGDYTACIQVKNESGDEIGYACIVQRVETPTSAGEVKLQQPYNLEQNYPNPFNSSSTIGYYVPQTCQVKIIVNDLFGKEIKILVNEEKAPGHHEIVFDREDFVSGIYFYTLRTAGFTQSKKMILIK